VSDARASAAGTVRVHTSFMALAFVLSMVKTGVVIDGQRYVVPWGTNGFPVSPGRHHVRVFFNYFLPKEAGANEVDVVVAPGETVDVSYRAPWLVFLKGRIEVVSAGVTPGPLGPAVATHAADAGWHPDPSGRHELRYWNGMEWTGDVSDGGVPSVDAG
jgi:hypothetical protein